MSNAEFPLLSLIMFTPLVGAIILLFVSKAGGRPHPMDCQHYGRTRIYCLVATVVFV